MQYFMTFLEGIISFISPCMLPMLPVYISYFGGKSENNQKFNTYSYMLNGYIDLAPFHWITPYVGAGIGYTKYKYKSQTTAPGTSSDIRLSKTNFTWSVGGGLSLKVTNRFNVDAGYRYYDMGDYKYSNNYKRDLTAQEVYGGIRYVF